MIVQAARDYIARGFSVVPIPPKQKGPVLHDWQTLRIDDPTEWFQANGNIGVITGRASDMICVDLDHPLAVELAPRFLPQTGLIAGRVNGGKTHWFYRVQGEFKKVEFTSECRQKMIEILGDGQQVVVGPSVHPSGDVYEVLEGEPQEVDPQGLIEACRQLAMECFRLLGLEPKKPKPVKKNQETVWSGPSTDLYDTLIEHGAEVFKEGQTKDGCDGYLVRCPREGDHTSKNGEKDCMVWTGPRGGWQARCLHTSCGISSWADFRVALDPFWESFDNSIDEHAIAGIMSMGFPSRPVKKPEPVNPEGMTDVFYQIPGLIGEMISFHREHAPRPRPELSLAASIALMGAVTGRKIQTRSGMRTNVYCVGLAPSGSGKEKPRNNNVMALIDAGINDLLGSENPASDAALISELSEHPAMLIQIDEVSRYFSTLKTAGNNSTHLKNIFTRFLELTGQAENPAWTPKGYADNRKSKTICHPHLCIYGTSTSDGFWSSVASSDAIDGFLARMMVIEADRNYPRLRDVETAKTPQTVIDILKDWQSFSPPGGGNMGEAPAMVVPVDSAASDRIKSHSDGIEDRLVDEPDDHKAIWSRSSALAKRLSLIFAASRGPGELVVKLEDAQAATRLANWCTRLLIRRVFTHVSANEADSDKKKVLEVIRRSGTISASELTRKTQWIRNRRARMEIIDELLDGGFLTRDVLPSPETGGHQTHVYSVI